MKKTVLIAAAFVAATAASAQTGEITSNRGENWLSQDGDWGLIFDAQPVLNYVGNLFNNGTNGSNTLGLNSMGANAAGLNLLNGLNNGSGVVIGAKKLVDANTAYRGKLRIGFGNTRTTDIVAANPQPTPQPNPPASVEDVQKDSYTNVVIGAGLEKRVGSTRVVGVYGGELLVGFGGSKTTYEYGNPMSATNTATRNTEVKNPSRFGLGLQGFLGIEWFFAPKMALSGEYTWGLAMTSQGTTETTYEEWDPTANNNNGAPVVITQEGSLFSGDDRINNFRLDTGVSGFNIGLNFYFQ